MKKYKLKKSLFRFQQGDTVTIGTDTFIADVDITVIKNMEGMTLTIPSVEYDELSSGEFSDLFEQVPEKSVSIYDLNYSDKYYYIEHDYVREGTWTDHHADRELLSLGNVFLTEEEAEKELKKRIAITTIKRFIYNNGMEFEPDWSDSYQRKYFIIYNPFTKEFKYGFGIDWVNLYILPYLRSEEDCLKVIENFEEELKTILDIK